MKSIVYIIAPTICSWFSSDYYVINPSGWIHAIHWTVSFKVDCLTFGEIVWLLEYIPWNMRDIFLRLFCFVYFRILRASMWWLTYILHGYFTGIGAIVWLPQCLRSNLGRLYWIATKQSKAQQNASVHTALGTSWTLVDIKNGYRQVSNIRRTLVGN